MKKYILLGIKIFLLIVNVVAIILSKYPIDFPSCGPNLFALVFLIPLIMVFSAVSIIFIIISFFKLKNEIFKLYLFFFPLAISPIVILFIRTMIIFYKGNCP
jgi:hypothetical protein